MQAIETKYISPTNSRGSRVKATAEAGSVTLSWDHSLNRVENHKAACEALIKKMGWLPSAGRGFCGYWVPGCLPNSKASYAWVFLAHNPALRFDEPLDI